ncbi:MAG: hypothetical protein Q8O56_06175 [Solirubrobacteraceae bacterium]|nr:hypothetical protein [Solirubrobacteraceae bacterium]
MTIDQFEGQRCELVLAGPSGCVGTPHRCIGWQALYEGEEAACSSALNLVSEVEVVEALEVGLEEIPAVS